jgi:imidazolonepropionase-like amidohydrolase
VLTGGKYLDVRAGVLRESGAIVVQDGKVLALHAPGSRWRVPADPRVLPLSRRTILPGLVDAHVHLTLGGKPAEKAIHCGTSESYGGHSW